MIYRIENIQLILENNTRINIKCEKPIVVHDLNDFRKKYRTLTKRRKPAIKRINLSYEEYDNRQ